MPTFLFIIIFLMNIITLIAVYFLFKQVQSIKADNTTDFSNMIETFLQEIRKENDQLKNEVLNSPSQKRQQSNNKSLPHKSAKHEIKDANKTNQTSVIDDLKVSSMEDHFETSLQASVLHLHNQGVPTEEIAQQLNCGKTEAALIVKLHE